MTGAVRLGDICSGHGCYPPRENDQGSPNVFVNSIPSHRLTDHWVAHGCGGCVPHDSQSCQGSPNVFVNGLPKSRIGDAVCCGSAMVTGSSNVFVNGS